MSFRSSTTVITTGSGGTAGGPLANSNEFVIPMPPGAQAGDLVIIFLYLDCSVTGIADADIGSFISTKGWQIHFGTDSGPDIPPYYRFTRIMKKHITDNEPSVSFYGKIGTLMAISAAYVGKQITRVVAIQNSVLGSYASPHTLSLTGIAVDDEIPEGSDLAWFAYNTPGTPATWATSGITAGYTLQELVTGATALDNVALITRDSVPVGTSGDISVTLTGSTSAITGGGYLVLLGDIPTAPIIKFSETKHHQGFAPLGIATSESFITNEPLRYLQGVDKFYVDPNYSIYSDLNAFTAQICHVVGSNPTLTGLSGTNYTRKTFSGNCEDYKWKAGLGFSPIAQANGGYLWTGFFIDLRPSEADPFIDCFDDTASITMAIIDLPGMLDLQDFISYRGVYPNQNSSDILITFQNGPLNSDASTSTGSSYLDVGGLVTPPTLPAMSPNRARKSGPAGIEFIGLGWADASSTAALGLSLPAGYTLLGAPHQATSSDDLAIITGYRIVYAGDTFPALTFGLTGGGGASQAGWVATRVYISFSHAKTPGSRFKKR